MNIISYVCKLQTEHNKLSVLEMVTDSSVFKMITNFLFLNYNQQLLREEGNGSFHRIKIGRNVASISHLMFADDTFLFCRTSTREFSAIRTCVAKYEEWSEIWPCFLE